jgi:ribonucleoside-diphosphate reductase alpha chain
MQTMPISTATEALAGARAVPAAAAAASAYAGYQIIRRNGAVVAFEPSKIAVALMKAFLAVHGTQGAASASVRETVERLTEAWCARCCARARAAAPSTSRTCRTTSSCR